MWVIILNLVMLLAGGIATMPWLSYQTKGGHRVLGGCEVIPGMQQSG